MDWQWFNALGFGLVPEKDGGHGLSRAIEKVELMKAVALKWTQSCPGWSKKIGLYFHVFGHNTVNSLHLHILDMAFVGPTFWHYEYKNCPIDIVLKVLQEEATALSEVNLKEVTRTASMAAKTAAEAVQVLIGRKSQVDVAHDEVLTLNVGGEIVTVLRQTMLLAPPGSLLRELFVSENNALGLLDEENRPYLNYPPAAFKVIVDHLRLIHSAPQMIELEPRRIPPELKQQVEDLSYILGVEDLVLYSKGAGRNRADVMLLAEDAAGGGGFCCRRRRPAFRFHPKDIHTRPDGARSGETPQNNDPKVEVTV
eukprot:TRINITY_DN110534_c0_g1_i1.p1 TRINITY_DN110534_c0_g1~~TRINITY_DN110534_c0_g1_i1.p1  ORF type:complete len:311 (-),score=40.70 TRINITY_DN110534_c0_g1_i1:184-1116(-)